MSRHSNAQPPLDRRAALRAAGWAAPVTIMATAAPALAASPPRDLDLQSSFGLGWYPYTRNSTSSGRLQFDAGADKFLRITGTIPGEVLSDIYIDLNIATGTWGSPPIPWEHIPGSNTDWLLPEYLGATMINGVSYDRYRFRYNGTVTATGDVTNIPIGFFFKAETPYYSGATASVFRYATAGSTPITIQRQAVSVNNTNVLIDSPSYPKP